ncbi:MAG: ribonuclease J [Acidimicrobiaceae bacterium]|nr:ribonuclease J [Acidimicrobiaceae bacterium]MDP6286096.1 ribonuclease J [Acidimicrobiales bacterium]HJL91254.1 ribonuclease J [Acidimicrobiales bacterium]HJO40803.1 ribonuclease J [Acidimicrobiales bacterium]
MNSPVHITFLGGLGEIGRNCAAIEVDERIVLLDCGQLFPYKHPGVDSILPDFKWLLDRRNDIEACVVSHPHEDHIGGIPHLFRHLSVPIYGSPFTLGMIKAKLESHEVELPPLVVVEDNETHEIGRFECEFLPVTHSTSGGLMTIFRTPQGVILHSSDFKLDPTPVDGRLTDLKRVSDISKKEGIRLLLADSTNAENEGVSLSESEIGPILEDVFNENEGRRIIVGTFSSHIHRIQQIADAATKTDRKLAILGPSMIRNVALARELGLLKVSDRVLLNEKELKKFRSDKVCIICTGSQAEPRAAISMMSVGKHPLVEIDRNDTVIFSSSPIPGNEASIFRVHNNLVRLGARIVHSGKLKIHTTGHGKAGELLALHEASNPELFIPVHGEYTHLLGHEEIALSRGMDQSKILRCEDGDSVCLDEHGLHLEGSVSGEYLMVDVRGAEVSNDLVKERISLGGEGFILVRVLIDKKRRKLLEDPFVTTLGWVETGDEEKYLNGIIEEVVKVLDDALTNGEFDQKELTRLVRRATGKFVDLKTGRRPVLIPLVEIN